MSAPRPRAPAMPRHVHRSIKYILTFSIIIIIYLAGTWEWDKTMGGEITVHSRVLVI
jgi:hypothetical protein